MKVIKKGKINNNIDIQIEDWNESYSFYAKCSTLVVYPTAIKDEQSTRPFKVKSGEKFRLAFNFANSKQCEKAFNSLINNITELKYYSYYTTQKELLEII